MFKNSSKWYHWSNFPLYGIAIFITFSISFTQLFLALALLIALLDKKNSLKNETGDPPQKILFALIGLWILYRVFHIFYSRHFMEELILARELLLFSIIPLFIYRIKNKAILTAFVWSMVIGVALPFSNLLYLQFTGIQDILPMSFRYNAFAGMNPLTFTATSGIAFFILSGTFLYAFSNGKKYLSIAALMGAVMALTSFYFSHSRGGYLALAFAVGVLSLFWFRRAHVVIMPIGLLAIAWLLSHGFADSLIDRYASFFNPEGGNYISFLNRLQQWEAGFAIWQKWPLLGTGFADYHYFYPDFVKEGYVKWAAVTDPKNVMHLHNDYLDTLVFYGITGFAILYLLLTQPLADFFRNKKSLPWGERALGWSIFAALLFIFVAGTSQAELIDDQAQTTIYFAIGLLYRLLQSDIRRIADEN